MFRKILLSTDLSANSDALIACVAEMKKLGLEEIVLAHVIYVANTPGLEDGLKQDARAVLEGRKAELETQGFQVTVELPRGLPAQTLASEADRHDVSLIVVGSHGRGPLGEAVLGSVSTKLLHLTRRPVLVFPLELLEDREAEVCRSLFQNVLLATDFSETAERIIPFASRISVEIGAPLTLFHVLDEGVGPQEEEGKRFLLEAKRNRLRRQGAGETSMDLGQGDPGREIGRKAAEGKFSLILMGSTRKGVLKEIVLGSTTKEVIRHGRVPVMVIPPAAP